MNKKMQFLFKLFMFYIQYKQFFTKKVFGSLILSSIAATGVIMYGYQAPAILGIHNSSVLIILGFICATASMLANLMLGTYSLITMKERPQEKLNKKILSTSLIGSFPYGFLCYFSYTEKLSTVTNVVLSTIVVLVNAGIGYTALKSVVKSLKNYVGKKLYRSISLSEQTVRFIGIIIGLFVSTTMYLATCHGLADLFDKFQLFGTNRLSISYGLAILSWIPVAALFANGNQNVAFGLLQAAQQAKKTLRKFSINDALFIGFCLFSGTAIFAMMHDAYDTTKMIPSLFKNADLKYFIDHAGIYIALLSSAALSFFAISNLSSFFRKKS